MSTDATHLPAHASPASVPRPRATRNASRLTGITEATRLLLRDTPSDTPMISRAGLRSEAHRARLILHAAIKDQQRSGR